MDPDRESTECQSRLQASVLSGLNLWVDLNLYDGLPVRRRRPLATDWKSVVLPEFRLDDTLDTLQPQIEPGGSGIRIDLQDRLCGRIKPLVLASVISRGIRDATIGSCYCIGLGPHQ
jgi:hypothetical protein